MLSGVQKCSRLDQPVSTAPSSLARQSLRLIRNVSENILTALVRIPIIDFYDHPNHLYHHHDNLTSSPPPPPHQSRLYGILIFVPTMERQGTIRPLYESRVRLLPAVSNSWERQASLSLPPVSRRPRMRHSATSPCFRCTKKIRGGRRSGGGKAGGCG